MMCLFLCFWKTDRRLQRWPCAGSDLYGEKQCYGKSQRVTSIYLKVYLTYYMHVHGLNLLDYDTLPTSVFVLPLENDSRNYTFALNLPSNSEDIYFRLSGPADYSWVAVGTGSEMKDSLMFLLYADAEGTGTTLSPRLCTDETEPVYSSSLEVETLPGTGLSGNNMVVNARCSNCRTWKTGSLDVNNTALPWIYALGPTVGATAKLRSDSLSANLERHSFYGQFFMNMIQATGGENGSIISTLALTASTGTGKDGSPTNDSNWPTIIHAIALCTTFVLLMPAGVVQLRVLPASVRWHWVNQSLATILAGIGGVIGLWLSTMFNKSKHYNSAHQVLGLICIIAVLFQWGFGFWHHFQYKRTGKSTRYGVIHRYLGRVVMVLAIVVGGIGLTWCYASIGVVVSYAVIVVVISGIVVGSVMWKKYASSQHGRKNRSGEEAAFTPDRRMYSRQVDSETPLYNYPTQHGIGG
ncbi:hypothetical protein BGW36DRAFT_396389 [Talaromyces proteolyticus]|uniref:Cytochrome b561 domain-containing protein n=1 Tax=Talaromyces proteolyticus TaxID=1131652 RepID=A0AAD4KRA1_9EURO|nr:uncharacterized protein BGW36DRAFT_396389 [Talaromyces proteolyticus]KAH8698675.1 hypothetical protein BGW36DRAFT_396389 [Talaromyces proteolyticus]